MEPGIGILWALMFSGPIAILSLFRIEGNNRLGAAVGTFIANMFILFFVDSVIFYRVMPGTKIYGIIGLILFNLIIATAVSSIADGICTFSTDNGDISVGTVLGWIGVIAVAIIWISGHNGPHDAMAASTIVPVTVEAKDAIPASTTTNLVVVSSNIADTKASQAMSSGIASTKNYNTYLQKGPATLQYVDGHMWYVFPLNFDGSGNKHRLNGIEPGYIMVSAEDPNAGAVERYDGIYSMKICQNCGQDAEPTRWAYEHGYKASIDDPTLEIDDQGNPYWTETINTPHVGWTFYAPSQLLVINAHTGDIKAYPITKTNSEIPEWVDRVYSQQSASDIAGWYGKYGDNGAAGWNGSGSSNAGRFQLSGDPVLVYTGDGHPDWRILLTSFNSDSAVSKIVIMDAQTGAMRVYTPQKPMGTEDSVSQAFDSASGQGANLVKANKYQAYGLTLHVIYGRLTWMATYEPEGTNPSFVGVGFVEAYNTSASNAVFGNSKSEALQNYLTQLSLEGSANGNAPGAGAQTSTVIGTIAQVSWDLASGTKQWYITLTNDPAHVYVGTTSAVGPAIVLAESGDSVNMTVQNVGTAESTRNMTAFSDARIPAIKAAGG